MHRRSYLVGAGLGTLLLAGCAGPPSDSDNTADGSGDGSPDGDSANDVIQLDGSFTEPQWTASGMPTDATGYVARFDSRDAVTAFLDAREGSTPDAVSAFVDATDFESAAILYLQSVGPNGCYREIAVDDIAVTDDAVTLTVRAVDTSDEETSCASVITYPSAFVRVTGDDLPAATEVRFTSGFGTTGTVTPTDTGGAGDR